MFGLVCRLNKESHPRVACASALAAPYSGDAEHGEDGRHGDLSPFGQGGDAGRGRCGNRGDAVGLARKVGSAVGYPDRKRCGACRVGVPVMMLLSKQT